MASGLACQLSENSWSKENFNENASWN